MRKLDSMVAPRIAKLPFGGLVLVAFFFANLASCGKADQKLETVQPLDAQENLAASSKGARAFATNNAPNFPIANLNDGTPKPWGAAEGGSDVYAGVVLPSPQPVGEFRLSLFSPEQRAHLRDIRVVAADSEGPGVPNWHEVRSRLSRDQPFSGKITIPPLADGTVVRVELDRADPNWGSHKIWGFACLSSSLGDARNHLPAGTGAYVRELQMK